MDDLNRVLEDQMIDRLLSRRLRLILYRHDSDRGLGRCEWSSS